MYGSLVCSWSSLYSKENVGSNYAEAFFFSWNHVAMKGKEKPREAPPIRTMNRRTLFLVWKGIFCMCVSCAHTSECKRERLCVLGVVTAIAAVLTPATGSFDPVPLCIP